MDVVFYKRLFAIILKAPVRAQTAKPVSIETGCPGERAGSPMSFIILFVDLKQPAGR